MRRRIVLDTDVASSILKERVGPDLGARLLDAEWFVSFATVGELWKWAEVRGWGRPQRATLERWLDGVGVVDSDDLVARQWGRSVGAAQSQGLTRPVNDAWIAACCLVRRMPLATFNVRDFEYHVERDGLLLVE